MTKNARLRFPMLASFARGYLHQDMPEEHGSLSAALRTFMADMSIKDRDEFKGELLVLSAENSGLLRLNTLLAELGSSWQFQTEQEVEAFFAAASK
jgi:hypothetical protein